MKTIIFSNGDTPSIVILLPIYILTFRFYVELSYSYFFDIVRRFDRGLMPIPLNYGKENATVMSY